MTSTIRSIQIHPTGTITTLTPAAESVGADMCRAIGCSTFDIVGLANNIDLFVDDEGLINGSPLNLPATILAHHLGTAVVLFGTAIAASVTPDGETTTAPSTPSSKALPHSPPSSACSTTVNS
jgi:hypothetical protein